MNKQVNLIINIGKQKFNVVTKARVIRTFSDENLIETLVRHYKIIKNESKLNETQLFNLLEEEYSLL